MKLQKITRKLPRYYKRKKSLAAFVACIILSGTMSTFAFAQTYTVGVTVSYNGTEIGVVQDTSVVEDANQLIATQMVAEIEEDLLVSETQIVVKKDSLMDEEELASALVDSTNELVSASAIYVDGDFYAAVEEEESVTQAVLDEVLSEVDVDGDVSFSSDVEVVAAICDPAEVVDTEAIKQDATETLAVSVTTTETSTQTVAYETIVTESEDYPAGYSVVVQEGSDGTSIMEEIVTTVDGVETSRVVLTETVLVEAVAEEVIEGTGEFYLSEDFLFLTLPMEDCWISSVYGSRWGSFHSGLDLCVYNGTEGEDVLACFDGVVITAEYHSDYGNYIIIDHGNGYTSLYAHLSSDCVSVGDEVVAGDVIGYAGNTGYSTGAHLHFELALDGVTMNPYLYLTGFIS